jgi:hypothetical protein
MNLENIYNQNYGSVVTTNGDLIAVGNPPSDTYTACEGFSKIGQVFLIKKDNFKTNYSIAGILKKTIFPENGALVPYYTEQSSSAALTASFIIESGSKNATLSNCNFIVVETANLKVNQSNYGSAIDLSTYFLAVGDTGVSSSYYLGNSNNFACVDIFKINPNYTFDNTKGIIADSPENSVPVDQYHISDVPICTITGSIKDKFGGSVSITNNYLAVGSPYYNNGRGAVYIYKYTDADCTYSLQKILSCSVVNYPHQYGFGYSICLDKKNENTLVVGSNQLSQSNVYLFFNSGSLNNWKLSQVLSQNTSSQYCTIQNTNFELIPSGSQVNSRYGYSVSLYDTILAVGAPNDLVYWEYSGSNVLRQRGSVYVYNNQQCPDDVNSGFQLLNKLYGDDVTFKDNLFGYSVSVYNKKILIGSPKPYFPFSSLFISNSINYYDKTFNQYDFGESTYCGQTLLYKVTESIVNGKIFGSSLINQMTTDPISKRKEIGKPFTAYGYSVSVSDTNLVVGSPIPLNDDFYLSAPLITESGSKSDLTYLRTSSYQSDDCYITSSFVYLQMEDCLSCDGSVPISGAFSGAFSGACDNLIVFVDEQGEYSYAASKIFGKSYIYDMSDLQTNFNVGNVFYNNNKLIINNTGSILNNLTLDPTDTNNTYLYMKYNSQITLHEKQYICSVEPGEFNVSTNPTAITSSAFDYGVINTETFNFDNLDIILRYINTRITVNNSEKWWDNFVSGDIDESIFNFYSSSYTNYQANRLTNELKSKCSTLNFDVNGDGPANYQDGTIIWKYFIQDFTINNYQNYLNPRCRRNNYNDMVSFLDQKTGKLIKKFVKQEFFGYNYSSSLDPTGSYLAPYITSVGLYSGTELVAIAKLAQPIKNTGEIPINIVVKWDT